MKYHFHRDTILATIFLFVVLWLLSVTIHTGIMEPGKIEPHDFDYTDAVFALSGPNPSRFDSDIVIVNIGDTDRAGIAAIIQKTKSYHPKAIGVDVLFDNTEQHAGDSELAAVTSGVPNLVMAYFKHLEGEGAAGSIAGAAHYGFANFPGDKGNVIRYCLPFYKELEKNNSSFASEIVQLADPAAYKKLKEHGAEEQAINYSRRDSEYVIIEYGQLLHDMVDPNTLKNKIVLIGFYSYNPNNIEDKMLSPKNPVFLGRSLPDMHGVVIHANIISMMLTGSYIHTMPGWLNYAIAIIIAWICIGIIIKHIVNKHVWFHIIVKLWQAAILLLLIASNLLLFKYCHIKFDFTLAIFVLIFSAEIIYVYEMLALWLEKRFDHKTIFKHH